MTYLQQIGKKVNKASELKIGDVVGKVHPYTYGNYEEIRLFYVEYVDLEPSYIKWFGPYSPYVRFKKPHVGFTYTDKIGRIHLHTPSEWVANGWYEMTYEQAIKDVEKGNPIDEEYLRLCKEDCCDLYLITDEYFNRMGKLIPDVEMPMPGLLFQTLKPDTIFDYAKDVKEDIIKFRELYDKIKSRALRDV